MLATLALALLAATTPATSMKLKIPMALATPTGPGAAVGTVTASATDTGVTLKLNLHGLPPGDHGFHVHMTPSCEPATADGKITPAGAAGGHLDPGGTKMHSGPMGEGHLGDLPRLTVAADGTDRETLTADRLKLVDLRGRALMIHAGGDNYSDQPAPLGGGGARLACGVVPG